MRLRRSATITFLIAIALLLAMRFGPAMLTTNIRLLPNDATYELSYDEAPAVLFDAQAWDHNAEAPACPPDEPRLMRCFITHPQVQRTQQLTFSPAEKKKETWVDAVEEVSSGKTQLLRGEDRLRLVRHSAFPVDEPISSYTSTSVVPGLSRDDHDEVRTGLHSAFPFASEWRSYLYFDSYSHSEYPIDFQDREERHGTTLYRFHQDVAPILMGAYSVKGEASQFYSPSELERKRIGEHDIVSLHEYYRVSRTVWVEPKTGTIVDTVESPHMLLARNVDEARATNEPSDRTVFFTTYQLSQQSQDLLWQRASHGVHLLKSLNAAVYVGNLVAALLIVFGVYLARKK